MMIFADGFPMGITPVSPKLQQKEVINHCSNLCYTDLHFVQTVSDSCYGFHGKIQGDNGN